jgi:hypothetical protein
MDGEAELRCAMTASPHFVGFRNQPVWSNLELPRRNLYRLFFALGLANFSPSSQIANDGGYRWPVRFMGWPLHLPAGARKSLGRRARSLPASLDSGAAPAQGHIVRFMAARNASRAQRLQR